MDGSSLTAAIRSESETELSRRSSSKALYAATGGEMDAAAVAGATASDARRAAAIVADWADDEAVEAAATLFEDCAATLAAQHERLDPDAASEPLDPMYDRLAGLDGTVERLAGLLARTLVAHGVVGQAVGFFVGDADPATADEFRALRGELDDQRERVEATLESVVGGDEDETAALEAATAVVDAAYDWYVETLESMGVKPKNVC
jgi:hypothetical protein